jgi:hypothetical protein
MLRLRRAVRIAGLAFGRIDAILGGLQRRCAMPMTRIENLNPGEASRG